MRMRLLGAIVLLPICLIRGAASAEAQVVGAGNNRYHKPQLYFLSCSLLAIKDAVYSNISGCIKADEEEGPIRMSISAVNSEKVYGVKVSNSGEFSFENIPAGGYIVTVTQQEKTVAIKPVNLPLVRTLAIDVTHDRFVVNW